MELIIKCINEIKSNNFKIQTIYKILQNTILDLISTNDENNFKMFISKLILYLSTSTSNDYDYIYKTKLNCELTVNEIVTYAVLAFGDSKSIKPSSFLCQFEKEILNFSVIEAKERVKYLLKQ